MKYYADLLFQYLTRKKYLHKTVGLLAGSYLFLELITPNLPKEVIPDYIKFKTEYGDIPAIFLGYLVNKHANGPSVIAVIVLSVIVLYCLYVELRIHAVKSGNKNIFFGLFQNINQTFNSKE